jgi:putative ABC transport system substrate-binding protein
MPRDQRAQLLSRRSFCWTLAGILVAPDMGIAQTQTTVRRIGTLDRGTVDTPENLRTQAEPLRQLGWVEGDNLRVERRYASSPEELRQAAEELVRSRVEVIVTGGTAATLAAKHATTTIPIVFRFAGDPVALGLVASLARPGGNVTGYSEASPEVTAKNLSVLKELLPALQRVGVLWQGNPYNRAVRGRFEHSCRSLGLEAIFADYTAPSELGSAIAELADRRRAQALVVRSDEFNWDYRADIADAAMKHGLPTLSDDSDMVRDGGLLIAYSSLAIEQNRRRAEYIDHILRGAKPADLPVQLPMKFELVINLKTAKALGLTVPQSMLVRADEVIR